MKASLLGVSFLRVALVVCTCQCAVYAADGARVERFPQFVGFFDRLLRRPRRDVTGTWSTREPGTWKPLTGTPMHINLTEVEIANSNKGNRTDLDSNGFPRPQVGTRLPSRPIITSAHATNEATTSPESGRTSSEDKLASMQGNMTLSLEPRSLSALTTKPTSKSRERTQGAPKEGRKGNFSLEQRYTVVIVVLAGTLCVCMAAIITHSLRKRKKVVINT